MNLVNVEPGTDLPMLTYYPNNRQEESTYTVKQWDIDRMEDAIGEAERAGQQGDNPIGCSLTLPGGANISTQTREFRDNDLEAHAEKIAYRMAQPLVGRNLQECRLYTLAEPCFGCAYTYDKGSLGMLFVAAAKSDAPDFFRNSDTLHHIWSRSRRTLRVVSGLQTARAVEILTKYGKKH